MFASSNNRCYGRRADAPKRGLGVANRSVINASECFEDLSMSGKTH
jgi:hypothetical protein